jgi:arylsulfatase A-like enzyme
MFYEEAQRVPFIVYDPDPAADATRGTVDDRLVEAIDVVPTLLQALNLPPQEHLVEGRSLLGLLRGTQSEAWRDAVFSELDYSFREARKILGRRPRDCRAMMVRTDRWKYVWWQDFRPMLFDLENDPRELRDLGADQAYAPVFAEMEGRLAAWLKARKTRVTVDDAYVEARTATHKKHGIFFGVW